MKYKPSRMISFLEKYELINFSKNNKIIILLSLCMIVGMILGSISVSTANMEILHKLDFLFLNDFKERIESSAINIFISSFSTVFVFVLVVEFTVLSFWGIVLVPFLLIFKGLGLGLTAGYLYFIYGLKGIAFYILIMVPGIFISSVGIVLFSAEGMNFSSKFAGVILPHPKTTELWKFFKLHIRKSGYALILLLVSSAVDVGFMTMFFRFFDF